MTTAVIIGCGDVSIIHTEALAEMDDVTLVGVCDPTLSGWHRRRKHTGPRVS